MDKVRMIFSVIIWVIKAPFKLIKWLNNVIYGSLNENQRDIYHSIEYVVVQKIGSLIVLTLISSFVIVVVNDMKLIDLERELDAWMSGKYALWPIYIIVIFTIYDGIRIYKRLRKSESARDTRKYCNQEIILKQEILFYKRIIGYEKIKIDIMKSFSPIPIILFFIKDILAYFTNLDISSMDRITLFVLAGIIIYVFSFISFWDNYKIYTRNLEEFERELMSLGIENVYEKKNDKIKDNMNLNWHRPKSILNENELDDIN